MKEKKRITNTEFAKTNEVFRKACEIADIEPSRRQASKYRMNTGTAFKKKIEAQNTISGGK